MRKALIVAPFAALIASSASAQELTYGQLYASTAELSFDGVDVDDVDGEIYGGGFEFVVDSFTFSGDIARVSVEDFDTDIGAIAAEYTFTNGLSLGLEHARVDFEGIDASLNSIFAVYETGSVAVGASIGDSDDLEDEPVAVFASFDVSPNGTIGAELLTLDDTDALALYADYDAETYEFYASYVDFDGFDVLIFDTSFNISTKFAVTAGYANLSFDGGGDADAYSVGAKYGITDSVDIAASYGNLSVDSVDADVIAFGLEFEIGERTSARSSFTDVAGRTAGASTGSF